MIRTQSKGIIWISLAWPVALAIAFLRLWEVTR